MSKLEMAFANKYPQLNNLSDKNVFSLSVDGKFPTRKNKFIVLFKLEKRDKAIKKLALGLLALLVVSVILVATAHGAGSLAHTHTMAHHVTIGLKDAGIVGISVSGSGGVALIVAKHKAKKKTKKTIDELESAFTEHKTDRMLGNQEIGISYQSSNGDQMLLKKIPNTAEKYLQYSENQYTKHPEIQRENSKYSINGDFYNS